MEVFDRHLISQRRTRAAKKFSEHDFLFNWAKNQLSNRLSDINRKFDIGVELGTRGVLGTHPKINTLFSVDLVGEPHILASEEFLPFKSRSLDLVLSTLNLHTVNDLPGALIQIRHALKDDGLFLACMLGGETLHELRAVMQSVELEMYGGVSPRVAPFADKPQMGDLLQRAGFAIPVVDSEILTVTYDHVFKLMEDLRGMGENNAMIERSKTPLNKEFFMRVAKSYQEQFSEPDGRIVASFEVIFLLGWAPHDSQQKPLRPGSAQASLAEALGSNEIKLGEKAKP